VSTFSGIATSIRTFYHIRRTSLPSTRAGELWAGNRPGCNFMSLMRIIVKIFNYSPYYSVTFRNCFRGEDKILPRGHRVHVVDFCLVLSVRVHVLHAICLQYASLNITALGEPFTAATLKHVCVLYILFAACRGGDRGGICGRKYK
jgi:hypothetical protein